MNVIKFKCIIKFYIYWCCSAAGAGPAVCRRCCWAPPLQAARPPRAPLPPRPRLPPPRPTTRPARAASARSPSRPSHLPLLLATSTDTSASKEMAKLLPRPCIGIDRISCNYLFVDIYSYTTVRNCVTQ